MTCFVLVTVSATISLQGDGCHSPCCSHVLNTLVREQRSRTLFSPMGLFVFWDPKMFPQASCSISDLERLQQKAAALSPSRYTLALRRAYRKGRPVTYGGLDKEMLRVRSVSVKISAQPLFGLIFAADELSAVVQNTALLVNSSPLRNAGWSMQRRHCGSQSDFAVRFEGSP